LVSEDNIEMLPRTSDTN